MLGKRVLGALSLVTVLGLAPVAYAADETTEGTPTEGTSTEGTATETPPGDSGNSGNTGDSGSDGEYNWGIETPFPTGGDGAHANFLKRMGKNWLDVSLGVNFTKAKGDATATPPIPDTDATFGLDLAVGYRMPKPMKGKLSPYLEPAVILSVADFSKFGDTMALGVGASMGVTYEVIPQFTLGTALGAGLQFSNKFKNIDFGLFTASITAGFWW